MTLQSFHTPAEIQALSNFAHLIEGVLFSIVVIIAFIQTLGYLSDGWKQYAWPGLILIAGVFLFIFLLFHHGLDKVGISWNFIWGDPQQRQHMIMAILLIVAGVGETFFRAGFSPEFLLKLVWPLVLIVIGVLFLIHPQHGTDAAVRTATTIHKFLGVILVFSGVLRGIDIWQSSQTRWLSFSWIILLLIVAILLMIYREPEGAYNENPGNHHSMSSQ